MCGRFFLAQNLEVLKHEFAINKVSCPYTPNFNIAPTQKVALVVRNGENILTSMRWGLIPRWAKDERIGAKMINARAETIASKPSFKQAFLNRRCLILADGFYEWGKGIDTKKKQPFAVRLRSKRPFAFAGLWDEWKKEGGEIKGNRETIRSCTIITTDPNSLVQKLHDRMPVILRKEDEGIWLSDRTSQEMLLMALKPYPEKEMEMYPVGGKVGSTRYNNPDCIAPINP